MTTNEQLLERIQKLLALSQSNGSKAEAESAALKAQQMITELNLTMEDVLGHHAQEKQRVTMFDAEYWTDDPWERALSNSIAKAFYCKSVRSPRRDTTTIVHFIGRESNAQVAAYVFDQMSLRMQALSQAAFKAYTQEWKAAHGVSFWTHNRNIPAIKGNFVRNWLMGAVTGLYEQLMKQQSQTGSAIAVSTGTENDNFTAMQFPDLRAGRKQAPLNNAKAYDSGVQAGRTMDVRVGLDGAVDPKQIH